jgi:hypothetical protein
MHHEWIQTKFNFVCVDLKSAVHFIVITTMYNINTTVHDSTDLF